MKILAIALFLALSTSVCLPQEMPAGWSKPPAKLTGQEFRRKDPNHFLVVTGDFNGDGIQDKAFLLVNQRAQKLGFFICLTTATGCDWHRLEVMDIAFLDVMGIAGVKPGQYETACGKGYWECGDLRRTLQLRQNPQDAEDYPSNGLRVERSCLES